jgi:hypothetical protein
MDDWLYSIREFWITHRREIKRYGLCVWILVAGIYSGSWAMALFGLGLGCLFYWFDHWGYVIAERGKAVQEARKAAKEASKSAPPKKP